MLERRVARLSCSLSTILTGAAFGGMATAPAWLCVACESKAPLNAGDPASPDAATAGRSVDDAAPDVAPGVPLPSANPGSDSGEGADSGRACTGGFIPDPGFGFSGTATFDGSFTITNASNPFGTSGPTLLLFDDMRSGIVGQPVTDGAKPVAGTAAWQQFNHDPTLSALWKGVNRAGKAPAYRILDDERAGDNGVFGRRMLISLGTPTTALYLFYAENWHGWNGLNDGATPTFLGGGYYKQNWFMLDTENYGHNFNVVLPVFAAQDKNIPTEACNTYFGGNDSCFMYPAPPCYLPMTSLGGQAAGHDKWDKTGWNSLEVGYIGDPTSPTTNNGRQVMTLYNAPNKQAIDHNIGSVPLFNAATGTKGTYSYGLWLQIVGLMQTVGTQTVDRADFYVAIGPNALKRFFIGDASTLANCTTIMPCTIDSWSAGSVTMTLRQGAFRCPSGNYLYWADESNNIHRVGQFQ